MPELTVSTKLRLPYLSKPKYANNIKGQHKFYLINVSLSWPLSIYRKNGNLAIICGHFLDHTFCQIDTKRTKSVVI